MTENPSMSVESRVGEPEQLVLDDLLPAVEQIQSPRIGETLLHAWKKSRHFLGGIALVGLASLPVGAAITAFKSPAETNIGTNDAQAVGTLDGTLTIDLGPGDYLQRPIDLPLGTGVHITVKGLHDTSREGEQASIFDQSPEAIAGLWSDTAKSQATVSGDIAKHAAEGGAKLALLNMMAYGIISAGLGAEIRNKIRERVHDKLLPIALAGSLAVGSLGTIIWFNASAEQAHADSDFNGTALEGWTVKSQPLKTAITEVLGYIERSDVFYEAQTKELRKASELTPLITSDENSFVLVIGGPFHCNTGVMLPTEEAIGLSDARVFITPGDTTFSGTSLENTCVSSLGFHTRGTERIWVGGNHDSDTSEQAAIDSSFTILNGKVVEVDGRYYEGDDSPRSSTFGQGVTIERPETENDMGHRLAEKACYAQKRLFALVVNEPNAAQETAARGCATLVIATGKTRKLIETTNAFGQKTWYFIVPDVAGQKSDSLTIGPLQDVGELTLLKIDKKTSQPTEEQNIKLYPDTSVEISEPVFL